MLEMNHSDVVSLIQGLPVDFRLVVARKRELVDEDKPIATEADTEVNSEPTEFERQGEMIVLLTKIGGHFRVVVNLIMKARLSAKVFDMKISFVCI